MVSDYACRHSLSLGAVHPRAKQRQLTRLQEGRRAGGQDTAPRAGAVPILTGLAVFSELYISSQLGILSSRLVRRRSVGSGGSG